MCHDAACSIFIWPLQLIPFTTITLDIVLHPEVIFQAANTWE